MAVAERVQNAIVRARTEEGRRRLRLRLGIAAFVLFPWLMPSSWSNMAVRSAVWALALLSLVVLTGWVGQISLAQAALMGVGAFSAAQVTTRLGLDFPFHAIVAGVAASLAATAIGVAALRIRGLYLAIATLGFQWAMQSSFLEWHPFSGGFNGIGIEPLKIDTYDFSDDRLFFYLAWPTAGLIFLLVANLRDSKTGRAWFAIRGSEVAAKTLGVNVMRYKLIGFAVSGFIVGIAGALNLNYITTATPLDYDFTKSITYLAVAVLGGIAYLGGALVGAIAFVVSDQLIFASIPSLRGKIDIAAAVLLVFTIIRNPGGLISFREDLKERVAQHRVRRERDKRTRVPAPVSGGAGKRRLEKPPEEPVRPEIGEQPPAVAPDARPARTARAETPTLLRAQDITVRFGGVVALDNVSLEVRNGEICGLIGPNGAGKTTLFNALNGLVTPASGAIRFLDTDVTERVVHERAAMGMARTFQIMRLFPRLTVFENLMIATHNANTSGFVANMLMLPRSTNEDARNAERVAQALDFLGIAGYRDTRTSDLPFGTLRLVELARALVTQPSLLLLDEPASGLDVNETRTFADHLFRIRDELGHTILLIEHDMSLVMDVCDYVYVLEFGRNLADGLPADVRRNEAVVAAYLGEEAVA